jgi:hypothetical protein
MTPTCSATLPRVTRMFLLGQVRSPRWPYLGSTIFPDRMPTATASRIFAYWIEPGKRAANRPISSAVYPSLMFAVSDSVGRLGTGGVVDVASVRCERYRPVTPRQVSFGQSAPTALVATAPNLASDTQTRPTAEAGHRPSTASVRRRCACARQSGRATVAHSRLRILGHSP